MHKKRTEDIEIDLLLEAMFQSYGYDFRDYARTSVRRRIRKALADSDCEKITEMTSKLLYDKAFFTWLLNQFSIPVTEFFRDPDFYESVRDNVTTVLKTYPFVKIWHAGCATGEEAYSLAIVLKEEGLYDRATIFATDINDHALQQAKNGIYKIEDVKKDTSNYQKARGRDSFSGYFRTQHRSARIDSSLKKNITFANYNLVTDTVFGEMHLILCRNVLIYFDKILQNRVIKLFCDSLIYKGFLCLGSKESLAFSEMKDCFDTYDKKCKIYRKMEQCLK